MYIFIGSATPKNGDEKKFVTKLDPEFRQPLTKKKYEMILKIFGGKN